MPPSTAKGSVLTKTIRGFVFYNGFLNTHSAIIIINLS